MKPLLGASASSWSSLSSLEDALGIHQARAPGELRMVGMALTSSCNLRCWYCVQKRGGARRMSLETLRRSLDRLLDGTHPDPAAHFFGGEPLEAPDLLRQAMAYARRRQRPGTRVRFSLTTNGTGLDDSIAALLEANAVDTRISFDGVHAVQEQRAPGTFDLLDRLLMRLRRHRPQFFREHVSVHATLTSRNASFLAESIQHFLRRGLRRISIAPLATHDPGWRPEAIDLLRSQVKEAMERCHEHLYRTGAQPLSIFSPGRRAGGSSGEDLRLCGAAAGDRAVVAADGQTYACGALVRSRAEQDNELWRDVKARLSLPPIADPNFPERLGSIRSRLARSPVFRDRQERHSSYGRCRDCRFVSACSICPVSIAALPGNSDPHVVPDLVCAWNLATGEAGERFRALPAPQTYESTSIGVVMREGGT